MPLAKKPSLFDIMSAASQSKASEGSQRSREKSKLQKHHYIPTSLAFSLKDPPSSPFYSSSVRETIRSAPRTHKLGKMSAATSDQGLSFRQHAKEAFNRILLAAKRTLRSYSPQPQPQPQPSQRACPKRINSGMRKAFEPSSRAPTPSISYPMKLHNAEPSFVTTADPWEASATSASLQRRATMGYAQAQKRATVGGRPLTAETPTSTQRRSQWRASSYVSTTSSHQAYQPRPESSFEDTQSRRSQPHPLESHRASMYRHLPLRPLSLSKHPRSGSRTPSCEENGKRTTVDLRRSSGVSSRLSSSHPRPQSWQTVNPVGENESLKDSGQSLPSDRLSVSTSRTDWKSVGSTRPGGQADWAGVIEEDVTVTLMGCPTSVAHVLKSEPFTSSPLLSSPLASSPLSSSIGTDSALSQCQPVSFLPDMEFSVEQQDTDADGNSRSNWYSELIALFEDVGVHD